jgi:hypothetical protein
VVVSEGGRAKGDDEVGMAESATTVIANVEAVIRRMQTTHHRNGVEIETATWSDEAEIVIPIGVETATETGHEIGGRLQKTLTGHLHRVTWILATILDPEGIMARLEAALLQVVVAHLLILEAEDLLLMPDAALLLETLASTAQRVETHPVTTMENLATGTTLMAIDVETAALLVGVEAETAVKSRLEYCFNSRKSISMY